MDGVARALAVILGSGTLMSVAPAQEPKYSADLLALLDPTTRVTNLCGGAGPGSMRANLALAAMVVAGAGLPKPEPLVDGLGQVNFPITTSNPTAQRYFNQGLGFAYGFNHAAAIAAFREAQRLDPQCAMCFWGEALAHGPNINAPMDPAANARSVGLARYAAWLARKGTPVEQALTAAMLKRYSPDTASDRAALDAGYADAMLAVAKAFPQHGDVADLRRHHFGHLARRR